MKIKEPYCQKCKKKDAPLMVNSYSTLKDGTVRTRHICRGCNTDRMRKYVKTDNGARKVREAVYRSIKKHKAKQDARILLNYHVKMGRIKKTPCVVCKSKKSEAHHPDYSKPLEVVWYCRVHHFEAHKRGRG